MSNRIETYDVSPRDGDQAYGVNMSVDDKLWFARTDDKLGVDFVEVGFPQSNAIDSEAFRRLLEEPLRHTKYAAFGMTRRKGVTADNDAGMRAMLESQAPVMTVVGKSSRFQVTQALRTEVEENRNMIYDSVQFLGQDGRPVVYDAEHFFDAFTEDEDHALSTLQAAHEAGAKRLVLCDTNGGQTPELVGRATEAVRRAFGDAVVGIHAHNDRGMAAANTRAAVHAGARHVQGTWGGFGERTGNSDLYTDTVNLHLDGYDVLNDEARHKLTEHYGDACRTIKSRPNPSQPFVGKRAFVHKGGMHASAQERTMRAYEFMEPEIVGNRRIIAGSKQSGLSNVRSFAERTPVLSDELRTRVLADRDLQKAVLDKMKEKEEQGFSFEQADASLGLLMLEAIGEHERKIRMVSKPNILDQVGEATEAIIKVTINGDEHQYHEVATGDGPIDALAHALRKALVQRHPEVEGLKLIDYKQEIDPGHRQGTASKVDVFVTFTDGDETWTTTACSADSIEAGWLAVLDGVEYKMLREQQRKNEIASSDLTETSDAL